MQHILTTPLSWCKLSDHGVVRFEGPDALSFLQGQLTNDVAAVTPAHSQYNGYCTAKGRLLAIMLLWRHADAFNMLLPGELCEPIRKRLSMYILRAKVTARDVSSIYALYGVGGVQAPDAILAAAGCDPAATYDVATRETATVIRLPEQRFLVATDASQASRIESVLSQRAAQSSLALWTQLDIEAGVPRVVAATQEAFIPQMVNLDLIHAVNFNKGCYPGQEIVARTRYLGKIKQRMLRASVSADQRPCSGDRLYSATYGEQACGTIVSAALHEGNRSDVLAVVPLSDAGHTDIHLQSPGGPVLQFRDLPYPVA